MFETKDAIKSLKPYIEEYETEWRLKLDKNENIYGASKYALSALRNFDSEEVPFYPVNCKHIDKFAEMFDLKKDTILFTNGIDSALNLIINTYLNWDDEFVSSSVTDDKSAIYAEAAGARTKFIDFIEIGNDIDKLREAIPKEAKICYISDPNNLTGSVIRISAISKLFKEFPNTLFVLNISYVNFAQNIDFRDYTDTTDNFSNVIIVKSFSNDYALASLGLSVIVSNRRNIRNLKILNPDYTLNPMSLNSLISALNDKKYFEQVKEENIEARELLYNGLIELGFNPYKSEANFILCDFGDYVKYYYNKLKNNGIIVKKFEDDSSASSCLRITVPKLGGVKFILNLLAKRDLIVFAFEDTLVDGLESYAQALVLTLEHFSEFRTSFDVIKQEKKFSDLHYFEIIQKLLEKEDIEIPLEEISNVFKGIFYNPLYETEKQLINKDKLLIDEDILEQLSIKYDMALVTDRLTREVTYSLKKFGIEKYFSYIQQDSSRISNLYTKCPCKTIKLITANNEILANATKASINTTGLIYESNNNNETINNFKHYGCQHIIYGKENILNHFEINI